MTEPTLAYFSHDSSFLMENQLECVPTKLLVQGFKDQSLTLDDLWQIFLNYGGIANIIIEGEGEGATVTFQDQCSFPAEANILMDVFYKDKKIQVMKLEGSNGLEGPSGEIIHQMQQYPFHHPPPPLYYPQYPPPLTPHYDAAILDVGQPNINVNPFSVPPPPINKIPQPAFNFDPTDGMGDGCHVCSNHNNLQPLTPMTPSFQPARAQTPVQAPTMSSQYWIPPPSFMLPQVHSSSTLLTLSGTSLISNDSNTTYVQPIGSGSGPMGSGSGSSPSVRGVAEMKRSEGNVEKRYKYFMSPYKKFAKFKGVPTPAKFPLPSSSSSHYGGSKPKEAVIEEDEDKENWYRAGDRWGHRRSQSFSQGELEKKSNRKYEQGDKNKENDLVTATLNGISNLSLK